MATCKSIMNYIHGINNTKTENVCYINPRHHNIIEYHPAIYKSPRKYTNLSRGLHAFKFNGNDNTYVVNNPFEMDSGDHIIIKNNNHIEYYRFEDNKRILLPAYRMMTPHIYSESKNILELPTINGFFDMLIFSENLRNDDVDIDNPDYNNLEDDRIYIKYAKFSFSQPNLKTINIDGRTIRNIDEYSDIYFFDNIYKKSYVRYRTNLDTITGMEQISKVDTFSNNKFSTYFIKNDLTINPLHKPGYNANNWDNYKNLVRSSHFKATNFEEIRKDTFEENAICLSADEWRGNGFYIKIANSICPDLESFIKMLNSNMYKTSPLKVLYPLDKEYFQDANPAYNNIEIFYPITLFNPDTITLCVSVFFKSPLGILKSNGKINKPKPEEEGGVQE